MTPEQFESELLKVANIQRDAGWSELSISLYAIEQREVAKGSMECILMIGAGLACDNTRFGVPNPERSTSPKNTSDDGNAQEPLKAAQVDELTQLRGILSDVYVDSGFRNLCDGLQDRIERFVNE